jgi:hypothetical protein
MNYSKESNSLVFRTSKGNINYCGDKANIYVTVRLNDKCKNGHQDFAITGDIYKAGRIGDKSYLTGGCIHEEIEKYFPEFKIFVNLHLCDYLGQPMHAISNMRYHMINTDSKMTKEEFCKYYRISKENYDLLFKNTENNDLFSYVFCNTDIQKKWLAEANKAIKFLESLTETKFINDSKRSNIATLTDEKIKEVEKCIAEGYYSEDAKTQRLNEKRQSEKQKVVDKINKDFDKKVMSAKIEKSIYMFFAKWDYKFTNFIYYNHSKTIGLNWKNYERMLTDKEIKMLTKKMSSLIKRYDLKIEVK